MSSPTDGTSALSRPTDRLGLVKGHAQPEPPEPRLFINRELSWLEFNERVLEEARDAHAAAARAAQVPRHRRLEPRRVLHGARGRPQAADRRPGRRGARPTACRRRAARRHQRARARAGRRAGPRLARGAPAGAGGERASHLLAPAKLSAEQAHGGATTTSSSSVFPALTPLAVDPGHPFPHLRNKSLNLAVIAARSASGRRTRQRARAAARGGAGAGGARAPRAAAGGRAGSAFVLLEDAHRGARGRAVPRLRGASRRRASA